MFNFLTFLFLLLRFMISGHAQGVSYPYRVCLEVENFTKNSTYQSNLNLLFSILTSSAPGLHGFHNASINQRLDDAVYGLFQCRGDKNIDECRRCVADVTLNAYQPYCPFSKTAIIWHDDCTVRYSNHNFFSTVAVEPSLGLLNTAGIEFDVARFNGLVLKTLRTTASKASSKRGEMFATQEAFTADQTIYTLAQCTGDLSNSSCGECLRQAISRIPGCCFGKQGGRVLFPSCYVRYEIYPFYGDLMPVPVPPPPRPSGESRVLTVIVVAIVVLITVSILPFVVCWCFLRRRAKENYTAAAVKEDSVVDEMTSAESLQFDFGTIDAATNQFSEENKLGQGGFGVVYKGRLNNGQEIAVKRLSRGSLQGSKELKNEVVLVAKLQHRNLVRLLGFCFEVKEKILIYEFIPNKSLDYFLYDPVKQRELDWLKRYNIINGIARGILYLHEDSRIRIIHRDLKASNILLDGDMNAKISDFGMARMIQIDQSQGNTNRIVGTYGYMSPEYAMHGNFSMKSDVYSFGVLILEIISGKKNNTFYQSDLAEDLLTYAWKLWNDRTPLELLDPVLRDSYSKNEVIRCIHIALLCVQEDPSNRPSMASIVLMLNSYSITLPLHEDNDMIIGTNSDQSMSRSMLRSGNETLTCGLLMKHP